MTDINTQQLIAYIDQRMDALLACLNQLQSQIDKQGIGPDSSSTPSEDNVVAEQIMLDRIPYLDPSNPVDSNIVYEEGDRIIVRDVGLFIWQIRQHARTTPITPHEVIEHFLGEAQRWYSSLAAPERSAVQLNTDAVCAALKQRFWAGEDESLFVSESKPFAIDTGKIYRFTVAADDGLDIALSFNPITHAPIMLRTGMSVTQYWYFAPLRFSKSMYPTYAIRPLVKGDEFSLDVLNNNGIDSHELCVAHTGQYSGQFWSLWEWADGTVRLSNLFTGLGRPLGVDADGQKPYLGGDDGSGQHWNLHAVGELELFRKRVLSDRNEPTILRSST